MTQLEMCRNPKGAGFLLTLSPVRSRWIRYGGKYHRVCQFDHEASIAPGDLYYRSEVHGSLCRAHAKFLFDVEPQSEGGR